MAQENCTQIASQPIVEENRQNVECRLCLGEVDKATSLDMKQFDDIRKLVNEVYNLSIQQNDKYTKHICFACYNKSIKTYNHYVRKLSFRKCFKMNQLALLSQMNANRVPNPEAAHTNIDPNEASSSTEKIIQTDDLPSIEPSTLVSPPKPPLARAASITAEECPQPEEASVPTENADAAKTIVLDGDDPAETIVLDGDDPAETIVLDGDDETNTVEENTPATSNVEATTGQRSVAEKPSRGMRVQQLVPVIMDCRNDLYLESLRPICVSFGRDDAHPLTYLCDRCYKTFKAKNEYDTHRSGQCALCCRYCQTSIGVVHRCAFQDKYKDIMPYVVGNDKYCTKLSSSSSTKNSSNGLAITTGMTTPESNAIEPPATKTKRRCRISQNRTRSSPRSSSEKSLRRSCSISQENIANKKDAEPIRMVISSSLIDLSSEDESLQIRKKAKKGN